MLPASTENPGLRGGEARGRGTEAEAKGKREEDRVEERSLAVPETAEPEAEALLVGAGNS